MLKMKLPMKTGEEGGDDTAEDDSPGRREPRQEPGAASPSRVYERLRDWPKDPAHAHASQLDKESVFEWFGLHLNPARRVEFMCGLLHMCQPLELRFLGSYLEDLARKDYHVLRDFECRANNPSDLGVLTDVIDPVVRSKLLVFLSLLGSHSRECAGILSRTLSSVDPAVFCRNSRASLRDTYLQPCPDRNLHRPEQTCEPPAGALEQLALLFTMASLHPAFHFHQREAVRGQLDKIQLAMEEERRQRGPKAAPQAPELVSQQVDCRPSSAQGFGDCAASHPPCQSRRSSRWATPREAVHIEGIVLRGISQTGKDKEYNFEVKWSDSSSSSVTKTHHELENFLLKLPKDQSRESFEKSILRLLSQGDQYESREVEKNLRERFMSAPPVFRKTRKVCSFFTCDSTYFCKPTCSRCSNCQPGKVYPGDCSDASSQEEDSYVQGHKKKQGSKSPCQLLSSAKFPQGDTRRGGHAVELNGPAERRKKSSTLRSSQEAKQHHSCEKRSHPVAKMKSRLLPADRDKDGVMVHGSAFVSNGSLVPPHRKGGCSGPDTGGETSSESYSSPSSPQHQGAESLDSEDDNNKDTDSHSDDCSKALATDMFFTHRSDAAVAADLHLSAGNHPAQMEASAEFPSLSFMNSGPCVLPNESGLHMVPHLVPEGKQPGTLMMRMPLVPPRAAGEPEKRDALPTFGIPSFGLHPQESLAVQPLVQRFKTVLSHSPGSAEGAPGSDSAPAGAQGSHPHQAPVRTLGSMSSGPASYSPLLPCQDPAGVSPGLPSSLSHVDTSHAKHHCLTLPSGMPPPYSLPAAPTSVLPSVVAPVVPSAAHAQTAVAPAVPTHSPGPAPSLSPALTRSTAQSNSTSYSNTSASCGNTPIALQQTQQPTPPQQQQQPIGCGACGCSNSCGSRGGAAPGGSGCPGAYIFPPQTGCMLPAAQPAARPVFSPSFIQLCSNSYLTQTHQANSAAPLQPFYATAPPPAHPSPYLHSHSRTEVSSHMMANFSLQQQMAPAASFCPRMYPQVYPTPMGLLPAAGPGGGGVNKKNGNVSCYNCGVGGHYAQDCNQPSVESAQPGGFRLKYAAPHIPETLDAAD